MSEKEQLQARYFMLQDQLEVARKLGRMDYEVKILCWMEQVEIKMQLLDSEVA